MRRKSLIAVALAALWLVGCRFSFQVSLESLIEDENCPECIRFGEGS